ncbi:MAG TPA: hypothetical protein VHW26_08390 [Solirubrobacteraceae bacterium]|nr:hypothetical protein [Solirubrobacteraceae bacterium]
MPATDEQLATEDAWAGELSSARPRRRLLTPPTVILAIVLFAVVGFLVGVRVEKGQLSSSGTGRASGTATAAAGFGRRAGAGGGAATGATAAGAAGFAGAGGFGGAGAASSAAGSVTSGTVSSTSGTTLYVQDANGNTVPVDTTKSTQVTRTVDATASQIHPGETVTVQGTTGAAGAINAVTIRSNATAAGELSGLTG